MITMEFKKRKLICVNFPGTVKSDERFIKALGGIKSISRTFNTSGSRLSLTLHPEASVKRWANSTPHSKLAFVMKVKVKRSRRDPARPPVLEASIEGAVTTTYEFESMADFQYLPMRRAGATRGEGEGYEDISAQVCLRGLPGEGARWLFDQQHNIPYIVPMIFSRLDVPQGYQLRRDIVSRSDSKLPAQFIGAYRSRRIHYLRHVGFDDDTPQAALPEAVQRLHQKRTLLPHVEAIRQAFEARPIWTRDGLMHHLNTHDHPITQNMLKATLPCVCYLFLTSPWRATFIKIGYDPRKHKQSKIYQTVDFRLKAMYRNDPLNQAVKAKRSTMFYRLPTAKVRDSKPKPPPEEEKPGASQDEQFKFRVGQLPAQRVTFYQLCDVELPEVQDLLHANDDKETRCTERDGWAVENMQEKARAFMIRVIDPLIYGDDMDVVRAMRQQKKRKSLGREALERDAAAAEASADSPVPGTSAQAAGDQEDDEEEDEDEEQEVAAVLDDLLDSGAEDEDAADDSDQETMATDVEKELLAAGVSEQGSMPQRPAETGVTASESQTVKRTTGASADRVDTQTGGTSGAQPGGGGAQQSLVTDGSERETGAEAMETDVTGVGDSSAISQGDVRF